MEKLGANGPGQRFYDPLAFRNVTDVGFGNTGRNTLRTPGMVNWDFSVFRKFKLTERFNLEFRAESFNFTNTPHLAAPSGSAQSMLLNADGTVRSLRNFMCVTGTRGDFPERQLRLGLKLTF